MGSYEFCGFSFRKNQERASKFGSVFGPRPGFSSSAAAERAPNWNGRALNNSYNCLHSYFCASDGESLRSVTVSSLGVQICACIFD